MKQLSYSNLKVHNEIALCAVNSLEIKDKIEKEFLKNRISYCEKWEEPGLLRKLIGIRPECTILINEMQIEKARELVEALNLGNKVQMIERPVDKTYF
ncbi:MAG: hypothetical protein KBS85_07955 [Lachnospiraceae bacterium]|nr:hypothetical protein [Candidatus Merdinaster equi]